MFGGDKVTKAEPQYTIWMTRKMPASTLKRMRMLAARRGVKLWQVHALALAVGVETLAKMKEPK